MRKVAIAMPLEGTPETARCCYAVQVALRRIGDVMVIGEEGPLIGGNVDVSKARDRFARIFLTEPSLQDCTDLLWWDEDVLPDDLTVINRMLESGYDVVGCPYPRKRFPESYPFRLVGEDGAERRVEVVNGCVEVDELAFGFMLTSRRALQAMWDHYKPTRWYYDVQQDGAHEQVGLFDLIYSEPMQRPDGVQFRVKLSEDFSFCHSLKAVGIPVHMYLTPLAHIGAHAYRGSQLVRYDP